MRADIFWVKNKKRTGLQLAWCGASNKTEFNKINSEEVDEVDIVSLCDEIIDGLTCKESNSQLSMYQALQLSYGALNILKRQVNIEEEKCRSLEDEITHSLLNQGKKHINTPVNTKKKVAHVPANAINEESFPEVNLSTPKTIRIEKILQQRMENNIDKNLLEEVDLPYFQISGHFGDSGFGSINEMTVPLSNVFLPEECINKSPLLPSENVLFASPPPQRSFLMPKLDQLTPPLKDRQSRGQMFYSTESEDLLDASLPISGNLPTASLTPDNYVNMTNNKLGSLENEGRQGITNSLKTSTPNFLDDRMNIITEKVPEINLRSPPDQSNLNTDARFPGQSQASSTASSMMVTNARKRRRYPIKDNILTIEVKELPCDAYTLKSGIEKVKKKDSKGLFILPAKKKPWSYCLLDTFKDHLRVQPSNSSANLSIGGETGGSKNLKEPRIVLRRLNVSSDSSKMTKSSSLLWNFIRKYNQPANSLQEEIAAPVVYSPNSVDLSESELSSSPWNFVRKDGQPENILQEQIMAPVAHSPVDQVDLSETFLPTQNNTPLFDLQSEELIDRSINKKEIIEPVVHLNTFSPIEENMSLFDLQSEDLDMSINEEEFFENEKIRHSSGYEILMNSKELRVTLERLEISSQLNRSCQISASQDSKESLTEKSKFFEIIQYAWKLCNDVLKLNFDDLVYPLIRSNSANIIMCILNCLKLEREKKLILEQEEPYGPIFIIKSPEMFY